jgi:hypothetical protein
VETATSMPSFANSLRMRGAPQVTFARAILRMRRTTSRSRPGRPSSVDAGGPSDGPPRSRARRRPLDRPHDHPPGAAHVLVRAPSDHPTGDRAPHESGVRLGESPLGENPRQGPGFARRRRAAPMVAAPRQGRRGRGWLIRPSVLRAWGEETGSAGLR